MQAAKTHKKPTILIVDDTPENLQLLGTMLMQHDYQINIAQDGMQALKAVEHLTPDIILLDIMMPELDGLETCRRLKASEKNKDIPIIFLTAKAQEEDIVEGFALGAVDYITKPFNVSELLSRVQTHLELKFNREMLKQMGEEHRELLHILCHDLANPLNAIISMLQLINTDSLPTKMHEMLYLAAENGLEIIDLVRKMRKLEEYQVPLETVNLAIAVETSVSMLQRRFSDKGLYLQVRVPPDLAVKAEYTSLVNSILNNLLTNAIKFSFPSSEIRIQAEQIGTEIQLSIQDHGIGMPPSLLQDLFEVSKATSRKGTAGEPGTGFGMPLVKKFMETYGGRIAVHSKDKKRNPDDHGTTIRLTFLQGEPV